MKIAVYYPWVYLKGGVERTMLELISRSEHDWTIFTSFYAPENTFPEFKNLKVVQLKKVTVRRDMASVMRSALQILSQKIPLDGFDAFVVWCDGLGDMITFRNRELPTFCICSTPLRPVYDPVYAARALKTRKALAKVAFHLFKKFFHLADLLAWRNYHGVISTSSEVSRRILKNRLYDGGDRFRLFYPGIDISKPISTISYEPFLLLPGRIMWTKNIELAIQAFMKADMPAPWKLVIAGFVDSKSKIYVEKLRKLTGHSDRVEFVISPSDEELNSLYARASTILFPPENEDWGIVPLEAMLRKKAVIANNSGGPAESVIHGRTGLLLKSTVAAWTNALKQLPGKAAFFQEMGVFAQEHVQKYDWSQFVNGVDQSIEEWCAEIANENATDIPDVIEERAI